LSDAARIALRTSATRPTRLFPAFSLAIQLLGREQFQRSEIRRLQLIEHALAGRPFPAVSRRAMDRIAESLNPAEERRRVGHKEVFRRECERLGLGTPRGLAHYLDDAPGWAFDGSAPGDPAAWRRFFAERCPAEFVVKPAVGGHGRGVRMLSRLGPDRFQDATGTTCDAADLVASLRREGRRNGFVIQERIRNRAELEMLSGSRSLQSSRLYTLLDRDGEPHLLFGYFKLIAGSNAVDNFHYGKTGNLLCIPRLTDGRLGPALAANPRGDLSAVSHHPTTGHELAEFRIPDWADVCALARRAARAFAPLRLVGWDIASTPTGPLLVEGNWNNDPPNFGGQIEVVLDGIRRWT
jgi:hypothetical protein